MPLEENQAAPEPAAAPTTMSYDQGVKSLEGFLRGESAPPTNKPEEPEEEEADVTAEASESEDSDEGQDQEGATEDQSEETAPDEEAAAEEKSAKPATGKLKLPTGEEITLEEAAQGYLRTQDYTRKTQELSRHVQEWDTQRQQVDQFIGSTTETLLAVAKHAIPPMPDQRLLDEDPDRYLRERVAHENAQALVQGLQSQKAQHEQIQQQLFQQSVQQAKAQHFQALVSHMPELADSGKREAFFKKAFEAGSTYGLSREELANTFDHRFYRILSDAVKWQEVKKGQEKTQAKVKALPPVTKPAARDGNPSRRAIVDATNRLRKTHSTRDGESAIEALLSAERR